MGEVNKLKERNKFMSQFEEEMPRATDKKEIVGTNFLQKLNDLKQANRLSEVEKMKAMEVGDYLEMSGDIFERWNSLIPVSKEDSKKLSELDIVEVVIKKIISKDRLLVEGSGVQKEIHPSLFYNILRSEEIKKEIVFTDEVSGFDSGDTDRNDPDIRAVSS